MGVSDYLFYLALLGPFLWIFDTLDCVFRGTGDTKTPLKLLLFFVVLNVFLNGGFAMGWGPFPQLGIPGIALATGSSWLLGSIAMLSICWRRGLLKKSEAIAPKSWGLWQIGLPITMSGVFFDLIWLVLTPWIAQDGAAALAAVSIGHRLESYGYMTSVGLGIATATLVGQAVGLQKPDLAHRIVGMAARAAVGFNAIWAVVLMIWPVFFYGLFTDDVMVWNFGIAYIALAVIGTPFQAMDTIYNDAFAGTGRTVVPMVINLVTYALRIPVAWLLMKTWGAPGVFAAIGLSAALSGLIMPAAFRYWGTRWENKQGVLSPTPQRSEWGCTEL
jgi:putative MATE family efflux protein